MTGKIFQPELEELIELRDFQSLREVLLDWTPADIAEIIVELPSNEKTILFRLLPQDLAIDTFEYLDVDAQMDIIKSLGNEQVASILNEMSPDDRTALLEELPAPITKQLIESLSPEERKVATTLLGYPEDSIGRLMTPDYIAIRPNWTVDQVLAHIRNTATEKETLNILYVVDERGKLIDDIKIKEIILSPPDALVADIIDGYYVYLDLHADQETAVETFKKYDRIALPVVDSSGVLMGMITVDDVLDVAEEEATEDIHKLGAVEALDQPYSTIPIMQMVQKRAGWLSILFFGEMLTATAMSVFQDEISRAIILTLFIPLIISSGGNSGSQAATLVIRALSLGEITIRDWFFVIRRELVSGLMLGSILGVIGFCKIMVLHFGLHAFSGADAHYWYLIAATVSLALMGIVLWGTLMGSMMPILMQRLGFDPAASSAPFVATMVDVTGLVVYFSVAAMVLQGTLL